MIVAIERNKFTYLYKYDQIKVDINQFVDQTIDNLMRMIQSNRDIVHQLFNKAIPLFEQDHEVILLEVDKSKIRFQEGIVIAFDSILCLYPLTTLGSRLLEGKISDDFIIGPPIFEKEIEATKIIRSMEIRKRTSQKLLEHFNLQDILSEEIVSIIESSTKKNLLDKKIAQVFTTFLDHLIAYNKTPQYIPNGNIEYICKVGAVAVKYIGKQEEVFTNGPFYKSSIKYKDEVDKKSYVASYRDFISITDYELKSSYEKMVEIISKDYKGLDIFKISYFFLAFKSHINKNDNNIEGINNEIIELINEDKCTSAFVLSLIGYTFSIENLYEELHRLFDAPILKSTSTKETIQFQHKKEIESSIKQDNESIANISESTNVKDNFNNILKSQNKEIESTQDNHFQKNTKPIDIHEKHVKVEPKMKLEEQSNIFTVDSEQKTFANRELPTVKDLRDYISTGYTKPKQKIWFEMLDQLFPAENEKISLESFTTKLDFIPDFKNKYLKTNKEKVNLLNFFNVNR
ncbi:hypothetical protein HIO71_14890 [Chryseobacterium aquaticum]|uniref:Uncharacterized protein n=1 Tax=Chryseobacterium aquaticum TaxID=452084 RepID=A0A848N905_9FLAO|nr:MULTISPECIES: hypothetical protein [Chryseobacterium]NMR35472.1 hypothetical protein [Chryseobacterium aquaticum]NRQ47548.1 hypothetical protein [Chryseobacterium sp. C-204]